MKLLPRSRRTLPLLTLLPALALMTAGCEGSPAAPAEADMSPQAHLVAHATHAAASVRANWAPAHGDLLKAVRQRTSRFNSTKQAERAGYHIEELCVAHPALGTMGHHAVNFDLVDPNFDPMHPEALLYAPNEHGKLELVGVEYVVINAGQDPPEFAGTPFNVEGVPPLMAEGVPHWSLHVWAHAENPSGTFIPFNPALSCN